LSAAVVEGGGVGGGGGVKLSPPESDFLHAEKMMKPNNADRTSRFFIINI